MSHILSRVVALALSSLLASTAQACTCENRSEEQQFREARIVVVGVVREILFIPDKRLYGDGYIRAVVDVRETLKGKTGSHLSVIDQVPEPGMCSSFLRHGIEYVLFVDEQSQVGLCSGTRPLGATKQDRSEKVRALRDLKGKAGGET